MHLLVRCPTIALLCAVQSGGWCGRKSFSGDASGLNKPAAAAVLADLKVQRISDGKQQVFLGCWCQLPDRQPFCLVNTAECLPQNSLCRVEDMQCCCFFSASPLTGLWLVTLQGALTV